VPESPKQGRAHCHDEHHTTGPDHQAHSDNRNVFKDDTQSNDYRPESWKCVQTGEGRRNRSRNRKADENNPKEPLKPRISNETRPAGTSEPLEPSNPSHNERNGLLGERGTEVPPAHTIGQPQTPRSEQHLDGDDHDDGLEDVRDSSRGNGKGRQEHQEENRDGKRFLGKHLGKTSDRLDTILLKPRFELTAEQIVRRHRDILAGAQTTRGLRSRTDCISPARAQYVARPHHGFPELADSFDAVLAQLDAHEARSFT
jgi:hypothetical protein